MKFLRFLPGWRGAVHTAQASASDDSDIAVGVDQPAYPDPSGVGDALEEGLLRLDGPLDRDGPCVLSERPLLW